MAYPPGLAWLADVAQWEATGHAPPPALPANARPAERRAVWQLHIRARMAAFSVRVTTALLALPLRARPVIKGRVFYAPDYTGEVRRYADDGYPQAMLNEPWATHYAAVDAADQAMDDAALEAALWAWEADLADHGVHLEDA